MPKLSKLVYLIFFLLVLVNAGLLYMFFKSDSSLDINKLIGKQIIKRGLKVELVNNYPGLSVTADKEQLLAFLRAEGLIKPNDLVFDHINIVDVGVDKVIITINEGVDRTKGLMQVYNVKDIDAYGFMTEINDNDYLLNFYLDRQYFDGLSKEELEQNINALLLRPVLYLVKIDKLRSALQAEDLQDINREFTEKVEGFNLIINVQKV